MPRKPFRQRSRQNVSYSESSERYSDGRVYHINLEAARNRALVLCIIAIQLPLFIAMIIIGVMYMNECPICDYIPIYLIASGLTRLMMASLALARMVIPSCSEASLEEAIENKDMVYLCVNVYCQCFLSILVLVILITGAILVYRTKPSYDPSSGAQYCKKIVFLVAFWEITIHLALLVFLIILSLCITCLMCIATVCFAPQMRRRVQNPRDHDY